MLKIKIVNGIGIEENQMNFQGKFASIRNRFLVDKFTIINEEISGLEGQLYWARPMGKGRIVLVEKVTTID